MASEPRQALNREPTAWENAFGDVLEAAFSGGIRDLAPLVERLNGSGVRTPDGESWTAERFTRIVHDLGA